MLDRKFINQFWRLSFLLSALTSLFWGIFYLVYHEIPQSIAIPISRLSDIVAVPMWVFIFLFLHNMYYYYQKPENKEDMNGYILVYVIVVFIVGAIGACVIGFIPGLLLSISIFVILSCFVTLLTVLILLYYPINYMAKLNIWPKLGAWLSGN